MSPESGVVAECRKVYSQEFKTSEGESAEVVANAELIVRAVNSHDRLKNNLKHARQAIVALGSQLERYHVPAWQYKNTLKVIDKALSLVEGGVE